MDINLDDVDLPTTKEKGKRVSTEIFDRKKSIASPEEYSTDYKSKVLSAFSGSRSSLPKKRDSTEIFDGKKFIAFLEEDSDNNSEVWSAFFGSRSSLPKKGDLVVYFPQGHLEYEKPKPPYDLLELPDLLDPPGQPPKEEVRTYDLQPQIICRVEHVQLMVEGADDDEICAKITLHPEPEVNSEEKELEQSDEIEDCICDEDGIPATISTPSFFSKILELSDYFIESLTIPPKAAIEFFCWDKGSMDLQNGVTAKDFHGNEWKFPLIRDIKNGNWLLGWSEFARARKLQPGETVVFLREKDTKLRFGIRRKDFGFPLGIANDDPLSEAAGAILKKSIFSVIYWQRSYHEDFVIPYHKYMKSITRPGFIGAKVHKQYRYPLTRFTGVVTGMADLDPKNWPNSIWKCLLVTWMQSYGEVRVSPWEIVFDDPPSPSTFDSSPEPKRLRTSQQDNSPLMPYSGHIKKQTPTLKRLLRNAIKRKESKIKIPHTSQQDNSSPMPHLEKHKDLLSDEAIRSKKQKHVQEPRSIRCEADTTNHPFDIQKQTPAPQTSSQLTLCPDLCSLTSFSESKSTTNYEELKISNCSVDDLWRHLKENHSYEYLEFDSCSFPSSTRIPIPVTIKKLKITNCVDTEQVFTVLMDPNLSVESLEIDSCSSFSSMSTGDTAHHSLNLTKQSSSPHRFLPLTHSADKIPGVTTGETLEEYLEIDSCPSKASLLKRKSATTSVKQLKICKCEDLGFLLDLMVHNSLEYLEFDSCLFHPPPLLIHFPFTLKKLKITNCMNSEHVLAGLVDQKGSSLESLEIDNCSSLLSFPIDKLPATLRQLKIVSCMNLKLFSQSSEIKNHDSVSFGLGGVSSLPNITSTSTLELRELEIWDCEELHSLPEILHNLTHLELLSLSNCSSLMYFPEGGLPNTCLKSLLISECDNLRSLPNQLHMVTSLQNLTVCGCPCLMSFPEGGLPPNLISLRVIDCENLISLSYWDLHNLNHLKKYSFIGGCPDLG